MFRPPPTGWRTSALRIVPSAAVGVLLASTVAMSLSIASARNADPLLGAGNPQADSFSVASPPGAAPDAEDPSDTARPSPQLRGHGPTSVDSDPVGPDDHKDPAPTSPDPGEGDAIRANPSGPSAPTTDSTGSCSDHEEAAADTCGDGSAINSPVSRHTYPDIDVSDVLEDLNGKRQEAGAAPVQTHGPDERNDYTRNSPFPEISVVTSDGEVIDELLAEPYDRFNLLRDFGESTDVFADIRTDRTPSGPRVMVDYTLFTPVDVDAVDDSATMSSGDETSIDVLGNDVYFSAAEVMLASNPRHGSARIEDGRIVYSGNRAAGSDSLTYTITDARGKSSTATVGITVVPPTIERPAKATPKDRR